MIINENCVSCTTTQFSVFFGKNNNGLEAFTTKGSTGEEEQQRILQLTATLQNNFLPLSTPLQLPVILLQQVHGTTIHRLDSPADYSAFAGRSTEGDSLITTLPNTAIGVLTADCLPIIIYNAHSHELAIVHAGWKGMIAGIISKTLAAMKQPPTISYYSIILGPAAQKCCYQVGEEFAIKIPQTYNEALQRRNGHYYLDLPTYAQKELTHYGIPPSSIYSSPVCTICDHSFYSHRREGTALIKRQATLAVLHPQ